MIKSQKQRTFSRLADVGERFAEHPICFGEKKHGIGRGRVIYRLAFFVWFV